MAKEQSYAPLYGQYHSDKANPANSDSANEWYYKSQEGVMNYEIAQNMAALEQSYAERSAAIENRYMIDQWNRENRHNDPTAVAARYRAAGINPRAAFGTGSASGAGLAHHSSVGSVGSASAESPSVSGSYGKSDVTQGVENAQGVVGMVNDVAGQGVAIAKSIGGLTQMGAQTTQTNAITQGVQIENKYKEQKIVTELTKERANIANILSDTNLKDSERDFYRKRLDQIDQDILESGQRIQESGQRIEESKQKVSESQSQEDKNTAEAEQVREKTAQMREQRTAVLEGLLANNYLKGAQEEYYLKLVDKVGADFELISKDLENYDIKLQAELARMTSSELRGWAGVLNEYLERRDNNSNSKRSIDERNRYNRMLMLRLLLPYLLK